MEIGNNLLDQDPSGQKLLDVLENAKKVNYVKILSRIELLFLFFHLFSLYLEIHFIFLFNSSISEIS